MAMLLESAEEQQTPPVSATSVSCRLPTCPPWLQAAIAGQLFVRCIAYLHHHRLVLSSCHLE